VGSIPVEYLFFFAEAMKTICFHFALFALFFLASGAYRYGMKDYFNKKFTQRR
jgi:hypothetical protein